MERIPDKVIIGDNPFIGVDHLDQSRSDAKRGSLTKERIRRTLETAFRSGASALMFSTHEEMGPVLEDFKSSVPEDGFGYYPLFPYAAKYARMATQRGAIGLAEELLVRLGFWGGLRVGAATGWGLLRKDPFRLLGAFTASEIDPFLRIISSKSLRAIVLHEVIVDLCLGLDESEPLRAYSDYVKDRYGVRVGIATRNFALLAQRIRDWNLEVDVIATPFNRIGFQMVPDRDTCVDALRQLPPGISVIAVGVLAAGLLEPRYALEYVREVPRVDAVALGTSRADHAEATFGFAAEILASKGVR